MRPAVELGRWQQVLAELGDVELSFHRHAGAAAAGRDFADVVRRAFMSTLEQRRQVFLERGVVVGAPEQPVLSFISNLDNKALKFLQSREGTWHES